MASILKVDTIQDQSGNNIINENADTITIGASGDTISIPSGATFDASNATVTIPAVNLTTGVTGTLPVANGGTNLTSGFANGITEADMWRINSGYSGYVDPITSNWERADTDNFSVLGTGLSESSGIFSFPSTGYYFVVFTATFTENGDTRGISVGIKLTTNNSTYSDLSYSATFIQQTESDATNATATCSAIIRCTDVSNVKISFNAGGAGVSTGGNSTFQETGFTCIKIAGI